MLPPGSICPVLCQMQLLMSVGGMNTYHGIHFLRYDVFDVASGIDSCGPLFVSNVGQIPHHVQHICVRSGVGREAHLVPVHVYPRAAWPRDISRHGE